MSGWECAIRGCGARFEDAAAAVIHQTTDHQRHECRICGTVVPEGYFAIRHAFEEHTRAEFIRAYDGDSDVVREREQVKAAVERAADLEAVVERLRERGALE